jgi:hypothetical protein
MSRRASARRSLALTATVLVAACSAQPSQVDPDAMTAPMTAVEIRAEVARAMGDTPLPPGAGWKPVVVDEGWYGEWSGGSMIEFQALCAWLGETVSASAANDAARLAAADVVLARIPTWRTFEDPALMDETSRSFVLGLIDDAERREFDAVGPYLLANCR